MATKNDLIEAQGFSRRRLVTAFVSGAPGGKELEPAAPLRAVFVAVALTAAVVLVGAFWGLLQPGLPKGWDNGRLVIAADTGARYVTIDGTLHPVINTASARLLIPSTGFSIISTTQSALDGVELGATVGIAGAPDALPAPGALANDEWTACVSDNAETSVRIGGDPDVSVSKGAVVVSSPEGLFVVADNYRYAVDPVQSDAILRAAGIASLNPTAASTAWLNLFDEGAALAPLNVAGAGSEIPGTSLRVGEVVHIEGSPEAELFLVQPDGALAALSPFSWALYRLGTGPSIAGATEVTAAEAASRPTAPRPAGGAEWPATAFTVADSDGRPCAMLDPSASEITVLGTQPLSQDAAHGVRVEAGRGALVRAQGRGSQAASVLTLIDATGTAFALPGATDETILRLGYTADDVGTIGAGWIAMLATGPALTEQAAGKAATESEQ